MAGTSKIEWTDATWNPVTGCTKISPGCDHCYAERFAERFRGVDHHPYTQGFDLRLHEARLDQPRRWMKPRRVFVNSMSDLFHTDVGTDFIDRVFAVMEEADRHIYQILTKRSGRMRRYLNGRYRERAAPPHIWCGVSVEDNLRKARIRHLHRSQAAVRFLSIEPLLERLHGLDLEGIHWVIVGGESGPGARPMKEDWVREIRDRCLAEGVPFFFKQWGGFRPKSNGRELDAREHNDMPMHPGREHG